ncbi:MAG: mandelate racemase/muconate lactonizing enzyme family protein [Rhodobacteraceae bacterium]|nr:mandelate racemase/muconate lactonizing enzyme family protein [Paracoccaceae bacterium]PHR54975.1 MAG: hypothetical protein COA47_14660 [Robiginitomaculum sp.]
MKIANVEPFQMAWTVAAPPNQRSAWLRITTDCGLVGYGEASPMMGGRETLALIADRIAPMLIGADPFDTGILYDSQFHRLVKMGPEGIVAGALAAIDIALWDIKGHALGLPIYKLLGGAWQTDLPLYASVGNNGARTVQQVLDVIAARIENEKPSLVKMRFDGNRTQLDVDIPGDIAKAKAVRAMVGDDFRLAFDANNGYSIGGAIRVGRALEELGFEWFEEPVQHYHIAAMGEVAQKLDITVSAGEQTYTLQGVAQLIEAGLRMVQPDIVKMGGITGMMQCLALAYAHGVEIVPHQTQPVIGMAANLHVIATQIHTTRPIEFNEPSRRQLAVFDQAPDYCDGKFKLTDTPGLGLKINEVALAERRLLISATT